MPCLSEVRLVRALLALVMQRAPMGFAFFDTDLRFVLINDAMADMNGRSPEDHVGRAVHEVVPDLAPRAVPALQAVLDTGVAAIGLRVQGITPARPGVVRTWLQNYYRVTTEDGTVLGIGALVQEVTHEQEVQERQRELIDGLFTFVGVCTPDGILVEANRAAMEMPGVVPADTIGQPFWDTCWWSAADERDRDAVRDAIAKGAGGASSRFEVAVRRHDGGLSSIDFQLVPLTYHGEVTHLVVSALDVTERRDQTARVEALAALSRRLNASVTSEAVARCIADDGLRALRARYASVGLVDPANPAQLLVVQPDGLPNDLVQRYAVVPMDAALPMTDAVRTGASVVLPDEDDAAGRYPHLVVDRERAGVQATAAIPFMRADGRVFGALAIGWDRPVDFTAEERAFLATVTDLCGQALERSRLTDAHSELARALQVQLLPTPPTVVGLDIGVTYRPAATGLGFGGDWYDVIDLGGAGVAILVGDVVGHGIEAAARMAEVRASVATLIRLPVPFDEVLPRASAILAPTGEDLLATLALVVVGTATGTLRCSVAGHPPPLVRQPDGVCREVPATRHPPVGMTSAPAPLAVSPFPVGSTLVMFTDGLVERRHESLATSVARLAATISAWRDGGAVALAHALADVTVAGPRTDDLAVAVVRHVGPGAPA